MFETFGFFLAYLRATGLFPFKTQREENGNQAVIVCSWKQQFFSSIFNVFLKLTSTGTCFYFALKRTDSVKMVSTDFYDLARRAFGMKLKSQISVSKSLDIIMEQANIALIFLTGIMLCIIINLKRKDICLTFTRMASNYLPNSITLNAFKRAARLRFTLLMFVTSLFVFIFSLAFTIRAKTNLGLDTLAAVLTFLGLVIVYSDIFAAQFGFYCIFGEFSVIVACWIAQLKSEFDKNRHDLLLNAKNLSTCLRMASNSLSICNFTVMLIWLGNLILISYRILSTFITFEDGFEYDWIFVLAYVFMSLQHAWFVLTMNLGSHMMKENVQDLSNVIRQTNFAEGMVPWNGSFESVSFVKKIVVEELQEFEGFDCDGYFTLGKAFISNVVTNFLTYLIILIQTKLTLISSFDTLSFIPTNTTTDF